MLQWFAYGNYIDEVLMKGKNENPAAPTLRYYVHDHLYSPVALVQRSSASVNERYEYDAYGNCAILEPNFAPDPDGISNFFNPYLFTGRRIDILDNGSLKLAYHRNRYYDPYTGRWITHDPLGITPNPQRPNRFIPTGQYADGASLYEYVSSNPVMYSDCNGYFSLIIIPRPPIERRRRPRPPAPPPPAPSPGPICRYTHSYCVMPGLLPLAYGFVFCDCFYVCIDYYMDDSGKPCTPRFRTRTIPSRNFGGCLCPFRFSARIVPRYPGGGMI